MPSRVLFSQLTPFSFESALFILSRSGPFFLPLPLHSPPLRSARRSLTAPFPADSKAPLLQTQRALLVRARLFWVLPFSPFFPLPPYAGLSPLAFLDPKAYRTVSSLSFSRNPFFFLFLDIRAENLPAGWSSANPFLPRKVTLSSPFFLPIALPPVQL